MAVLARREPLYRAAADLTLSTEVDTPAAVAARILTAFAARETGATGPSGAQ